MEKQSERDRKSGAGQSGKRKYEPPEIRSQEVFETTALACGKVPPKTGKCSSKPRAS